MKQNYQRFRPDFKNKPKKGGPKQVSLAWNKQVLFSILAIKLGFGYRGKKYEKHNQTQSTTKTNQTEMAKIFQSTNRHKFLR